MGYREGTDELREIWHSRWFIVILIGIRKLLRIPQIIKYIFTAYGKERIKVKKKRIKVGKKQMNQKGKTNMHPKMRKWKCYRMIAPTCDVLIDYSWRTSTTCYLLLFIRRNQDLAFDLPYCLDEMKSKSRGSSPLL